MKPTDVQPVYPATEAPRTQVVAYIKALTGQAKQLPEHEREHVEHIPVPPYEKNYRRYEGKGYDIVCAITGTTLQDWILSGDRAEDLAEINSIAGQLEIDTDKKDLWQNLFEKVDKLQA
jgi:hypothetical protein